MSRFDRTPAEEIERAESALWALDAGAERERWYRWSMAAKAAGVPFETWLAWCETGGNFAGADDCRAVWKSIRDGGIGEGTLFAAAIAAGWQDPTARKPAQPAPAPPARKPLSGAPAAPAPATKRPQLDPAEVWSRCIPATHAHPYIQRKGGDTAGLRVYPEDAAPLTIAGQSMAGWLVVPVVAPAGELASLQFIAPNRPATGPGKLNLPGAPVRGMFVLPAAETAEPGFADAVAVCEGLSCAWAIRRATGAAAAVAFGSGRMEAAARQVAAELPGRRLILVGDTGKGKAVEAAARQLKAAWICPPESLGFNADCGDLAERDGIEAVAELLRAARRTERFPIIGAAELLSLPPVRWRVASLLPERGLACVFGAPGSGKSFLTLDLAAAIAAGRPWFGLKTRQAPVLYAALEGIGGVAQRVRAYSEAVAELPPAFGFGGWALDVREPAERAELAEAIRAAGFGDSVVILDTLAAAAAGVDENSAAEMGALVGALAELAAEVGGLLLVVAHAGKNAAAGLRGHSVLTAALDALIETERPDAGPRKWRSRKVKDASDGHEHHFELRVVELGTDSAGDPVSSCIVLETGAPAPEAGRRPKPQGEHQRVALPIADALLAQAGKAGELGRGGAPAWVPSVSRQAVLDRVADALVLEKHQQPRRRQRAEDAIAGLVRRGCLVEGPRGEWLWAPPGPGERPDPEPAASLPASGADSDPADDDAVPF